MLSRQSCYVPSFDDNYLFRWLSLLRHTRIILRSRELFVRLRNWLKKASGQQSHSWWWYYCCWISSLTREWFVQQFRWFGLKTILFQFLRPKVLQLLLLTVSNDQAVYLLCCFLELVQTLAMTICRQSLHSDSRVRHMFSLPCKMKDFLSESE